MYISTDVRTRSTSDAVREPTAYTFAPGAASFFAILSQVNKPTEDTDAANGTSPVETDEKVVDADRERADAVDEKSTTENDSDDVTNVEKTTEADTAEVQPENTDAADADANTPNTDVAADPSSLTGDIQVEQRTTPGRAAQATSPEVITTAPPAAPSPEVSPAGAPQATVATTVAAPGPESSDGSEEIPTEGLDAVVEEIPAPAPTFPKNLNAVRAEGAVRGKTELSGDATKALNLENASNADPTLTEASAEDPPPPPALPRAAAMESAGVRPEATAVPRVPLVNLPGELAQQIHMLQQEGMKTMRLRLVPEHLGELHIEIQGTGDTMRVRLVSANAAVRDALSGQMGDLKEALQKHGLSLDQATVDSGGTRQETTPEQQRTPTPAYRESAHVPTSSPQSTSPRSAASPLITSNAINVLA